MQAEAETEVTHWRALADDATLAVASLEEEYAALVRFYLCFVCGFLLFLCCADTNIKHATLAVASREEEYAALVRLITPSIYPFNYVVNSCLSFFISGEIARCPRPPQSLAFFNLTCTVQITELESTKTARILSERSGDDTF
jgi:hypothetical protein